MNVLITSASRKVSLVRAFQEALAMEGGGRVVAVDVSPFSPALCVADEHFLVPRTTEPGFLDTMLLLCERQGIRLFVPTRDEELPFFARHKAALEAIGATVMVPDPDCVRTCQDKRLFVEFCQQRGLGVPKTYAADEVRKGVPLPVFVKPRKGKGGMKTARVETETELSGLLERIDDVVVQECIEAPEYTLDFFADFDGRAISVVPRRRVRTFGGESFVSITTKDRLLMTAGVELAGELQLVGHNTIQCFLDTGGVKFIEVNPRFGGGASLGFRAGAPTPLFLVRLLKGDGLEPRIGDFKDDLVMLRHTEDIFLESDLLPHRGFP